MTFIDPSLLITIDRTGLDLPPLVFSGTLDENALGIMDYQPPAMQSRVSYAPDSRNVHGSEANGAAWQQAVLGWDWARDGALTETEIQASYFEVVAAVGQFRYLVTTQVSDAPGLVWRADMGSCIPSPRTYEDLANLSPAYSVTIPVYPIPGSA